MIPGRLMSIRMISGSVERASAIRAGATRHAGPVRCCASGGRSGAGAGIDQLRKAEDCVERRARLVANAREELGIRKVGALLSGAAGPWCIHKPLCRRRNSRMPRPRDRRGRGP